MKIFTLTFFAVLALTIIGKAQHMSSSNPEKMLIRGEIGQNLFEMNLIRDANNLNGTYFYVKSGKSNSVKVRGTIQSDGKFILRQFSAANRQSGEFRGTLIEDPVDFIFTMDAVSKNKGQKGRQFYAYGEILNFSNDWRISTHYIREKNKRKHFEIEADYPEIISSNGTDVSGFNLLVKKRTNKAVNRFRQMMIGQTEAELKLIIPDRNELSLNYSIKFADNDFISVELTHSDFSNGMQHELYYSVSLNYDLKNRRQIKLADLFKPNSKYLETLSAYCLKELQSRPPVNGEKLADGDWESGVKPEADNFENWYLTNKGLLILFGEYQIAAYPAGVNYVLIPFSKLKEIAKPGGWLTKMEKRGNL